MSDDLRDSWPAPPRGALTGVSVGVVSDNADPDGLGRVRVRMSWLPDGEASWWARVASPMAGKQRGAYFLPDVGDEVLVAFEHGRPDLAYVIGGLWNGVDRPPTGNDDKKNNLRMIRSRSGHELRFDDTDGAATIALHDQSGDNAVIIDVAGGVVTVKAAQEVRIVAGARLVIGDGNADLAVDCKRFTVTCSELTVNDGALEVR